MTKNMQILIDDAKAAGYEIEIQKDWSTIQVIKKIGRWRKPSGLVIYHCGTAFRLDVPCGLAKGIRSYKVMREILGIRGG